MLSLSRVKDKSQPACVKAVGFPRPPRGANMPSKQRDDLSINEWQVCVCAYIRAKLLFLDLVLMSLSGETVTNEYKCTMIHTHTHQ